MDRKEGSRRHVRNWGGVDFDNVKTGSELEKEWTVSALFCFVEDLIGQMFCMVCLLVETIPLMKIRTRFDLSVYHVFPFSRLHRY